MFSHLLDKLCEVLIVKMRIIFWENGSGVLRFIPLHFGTSVIDKSNF